ncbi:MAG TPA: ABC transporter permease [Gemmatimonadaceae bacterium]|jgi:predicted permease
MRPSISAWLETVRLDVRYAVRTLRRELGFTAFAVLIVGLGVGASATVFSLVNGVLLKPMPFRDPARLVWISNISDNGVDEWRLEVNNYLDLKNRSHTVADMAGYYAYTGTGNAPVTENGETHRLTRIPVTCNFFPFLGVAPILGRNFTEDECRFNAAPTVMLTEDYWREHYAADRSIIGRTITINDAPVTVIAVIPASFNFPTIFSPGSQVQFFNPFPLSTETDHNGNTLAIIGRLAAGATVASARNELVPMGKEISDAHPHDRNTIRPKVTALDERVNGQVRPTLLVLMAAVAAVMLIVCANLASLQYARMISRRREHAVRLALGAARGRLIRQALTESLVLAAAGGALGIGLAIAGTRLVSQLTAFAIPLLARVGVDTWALGVALLVTVVTGVIVGVLPAIHAPGDVSETLKDSTRGSTRGAGHARVRSALVVTEVAAACVLLVSSGLLIRSFVKVLDVQLGYKPESAITMRVDPPRRFDSLAVANVYYDEIVRKVRALPGVTGASLGDLLPFGGDRSWSVAGVGQTYERGQYPEAFIRVVGTDWFKTMGIELKEGRGFNDGDAPGAPLVVVVNETLAKTLWPGQDAIGQEIGGFGRTPMRVVGVVGDVRHDALEKKMTSELYYPMRENRDYGAVNLVVRTNAPQAQIAQEVRSALEPVAPAVAKNEWQPLQLLIDKVLSPRRFVVMLLGGFAAFALVLAALGIYALVSYGVTQRTAEFGIRMALGASARDVSASVVRGTLGLAALGVVLGVIGSVAAVPALRGMLFGVTWADPVSFAAALGVLLVVALLAGWLPARRAASVEPGVALRDG